MGYSVIEAAIRTKIVGHFANLSDTRVVCGDIDSLFDAMMSEGVGLGVLLDYENGKRLRDAPFNGKMWAWYIEANFFIQYTGNNAEMESKAREVVQGIFTLFDGDHTVGGITPIAVVLEILQPEPGKINDIPFYWIPFKIQAMEKV